jgi:23S rRNA (pseudouridine1915-N3)-methyltransferase
MKWCIWMTGKTTPGYFSEGCAEYIKRMGRLAEVEWTILPDIRQAANMSPEVLKRKESEQVLQRILPSDLLVLLDERGKTFSSESFAAWLEKTASAGHKRCIFLIGGAFGFDEIIYQRADALLSLSPMTMSHQLARVVFAEQLYRGFCINKGLPYHHA